jgi:hypothetical protein
VNPPRGLHSLFIACHDPRERQFRGLGRLLRLLARGRGAHAAGWDGSALNLSRRRVLARVLISGHGSPAEARFSVPGLDPLEPSCLRLPPPCRLYLLGCSQGSTANLRAWAEGTGLSPERVGGCAGETETALTTCLLLHLLEEGIEALERWFPVWVRSNNVLRPHFPEIRRTYTGLEGDPVATLQAVAGRTDIRLFAGFLEVVDRHPEYLRDLA